jgi:glutaminase
MGNIDKLKECKKKGMNLDACDYDFRTALHLASAVGNRDAVKWLLDNGAKVQVDRFGGLPIHDAIRNNHV